MEELEKKYPDFEKRTGWRLDSAYKEEMPEDLAQEVTKVLASAFLGCMDTSTSRWLLDAGFPFFNG